MDRGRKGEVWNQGTKGGTTAKKGGTTAKRKGTTAKKGGVIVRTADCSDEARERTAYHSNEGRV
jgi:hypothetical protein